MLLLLLLCSCSYSFPRSRRKVLKTAPDSNKKHRWNICSSKINAKKDKQNDKRLKLIDRILIYGLCAASSGQLCHPTLLTRIICIIFDFSHIHLLRVIVGAAIMMYCRILGIIIVNDGNGFGLSFGSYESNGNVFLFHRFLFFYLSSVRRRCRCVSGKSVENEV